MEKVSIIVPIYNVERFLNKSVQSIVKQTYQNLEIILVDDGSKDSSGKIADDLAKSDARIKVIHKENGGLSSARNEGMKHATGELIAFLDSDDCIIPDFYEYLYHMIQKYNVDIAQGAFLRISDDLIDNVNEIIEKENSKIQIIERVLTRKEALETLYGIKEQPYVQEVVVWNKLYRRSVLENIAFPNGKLHEDEFTTHKILFNCDRIAVSNKIIHGYMQTKNSIMRKEIGLNRVKDCLGASMNAMEFFAKKDIHDFDDKISMRFLENCIELSGKIILEENNNKLEKLEYIRNEFENVYQAQIECIENNTDFDELQIAVLSIIKQAYQNKKLENYWPRLKNIIS